VAEISISAELGASIDGLASQVRRANERAQQALNHAPAPAAIHGQGATGASGACVFSCGGPSQGRVWQIRSLAVGGDGLVAGTARFYAAGSVPSSAGVQMIGLRDVTTFKTSAVRTRFYSAGQFVLHAPTTLWVVVVTATVTKAVLVDGIADTYDFAAYHAVTVL
jgi:hypothetical protein